MRNTCHVRRTLGRSVFSLICALCGCSAERGAVAARPSLLESFSTEPTYPTPAEWRYHPRQTAPMAARYDLGDGRTLFAGSGGERWLHERGKAHLEAAARLAPEDLVAILPAERGRWLFVGKSGTTYEAPEPLAAFSRSSTPFEPLAKVTASSGILLGVTRQGSLRYSKDTGVSWQAVGPKTSRFTDVELARDGSALALETPERLWMSKDHGRSWSATSARSVGAFALSRRLEPATVLVHGAFSVFGWDFRASRLAAASGGLPDDKLGLGARPLRGPNARAIKDGRAVVSGNRYLELELDKTGKWRVWHGRLDAPLEARVLAAAEGCRVLKLGAFEQFVYLACSREPKKRTMQPFGFFRSVDGGKTFVKEDYAAMAGARQMKLAVGADGALLVTGICAKENDEEGCSAHGVYYRGRAKAKPNATRGARNRSSRKTTNQGGQSRQRRPRGSELRPAATPSLKDVADALAFSSDGRTAYLIGRRTKNMALALFVSRDEGRTFTARDIDGFSGASAEPEARGRARAQIRSIQALTPAEDGSVAIVAETDQGPMLMTADDEGRTLSAARAPEERSLLGAAGSRALAIGIDSGQVFETLDGGASWEVVDRIGVDLCEQNSACDAVLSCASIGCIVNDELSRIGWRGQGEEDAALLSAPETADGGLFERRLREPIACALEEGPWRPLSGMLAMPQSYQAGFGNVAWFALMVDPDAAAVYSLHGKGGARPQVEQVTLLPPVSEPERYALYYTGQVEGAAALRYVIPERDDKDVRLRDVEVAWDNRFEGRIGRGRIADGGPYMARDYERGGSRVQRAKPDLVSIAAGGLYVRLHHAPGDKQVTYFFDGHKVTEVPPVEWPAPSSRPGYAASGPLGTPRAEIAHIGSAHVPFMILGAGAILARARREPPGWVFDAYSTGLLNPGAFDLGQHRDITYVAGRAALYIHTQTADGGQARGNLFVLRAAGNVAEAPLPAPTQLALGERPPRCSSEARNQRPRVVVPFQAGTRHPVVIVDSAEPQRALMTSSAVLHGTPDEPCVVVYDAEPVVEAAASNEKLRALLPFDDLGHSWLFRVVRDERGVSGDVEYRLMNCKLDASVEVPAELYRAPGTRVRLPAR